MIISVVHYHSMSIVPRSWATEAQNGPLTQTVLEATQTVLEAQAQTVPDHAHAAVVEMVTQELLRRGGLPGMSRSQQSEAAPSVPENAFGFQEPTEQNTGAARTIPPNSWSHKSGTTGDGSENGRKISVLGSRRTPQVPPNRRRVPPNSSGPGPQETSGAYSGSGTGEERSTVKQAEPLQQMVGRIGDASASRCGVDAGGPRVVVRGDEVGGSNGAMESSRAEEPGSCGTKLSPGQGRGTPVVGPQVSGTGGAEMPVLSSRTSTTSARNSTQHDEDSGLDKLRTIVINDLPDKYRSWNGKLPPTGLASGGLGEQNPHEPERDAGVKCGIHANDEPDWTMCYVQNLPNRYGPVTILNLLIMNYAVQNQYDFQVAARMVGAEFIMAAGVLCGNEETRTIEAEEPCLGASCRGDQKIILEEKLLEKMIVLVRNISSILQVHTRQLGDPFVRQYFPITDQHKVGDCKRWLNKIEAALGEYLPAFEKVPGMVQEEGRGGEYRMEDEEEQKGGANRKEPTAEGGSAGDVVPEMKDEFGYTKFQFDPEGQVGVGFPRSQTMITTRLQDARNVVRAC